MALEISSSIPGLGQVALAGLTDFFRLFRLNANRLSRRNRRDANRPVRGYRSARYRLRRPEIHPAAGTELGLLPDHARGDAVDVGNELAAKLHRIAHTGLLLFGGIGLGSGCE